MQIYDQPTHTYSDKSAIENMEDYWTLERVIKWLEAKNLKSAIEMFKAKRIYGRAFLELDPSYFKALPQSERKKLAYSIRSIPRVKVQEHFYSYNTNRSDLTTPLIPERKSSTNEHVLNLVKNIPIPTKLPIGAATARNNRLFPSNTMTQSSPSLNDQNWQFSTARSNTTEYQQNIHVTTDSDTFHSLQVTGMRDPQLIKTSILKKLGLGFECSQFMFFHENGKYPNVPLFDNELSLICQNSEHSSTNRILVKPKSGYYTSYCIDGTRYCDFAPQRPPYTRENPQKNISMQEYNQNTTVQELIPPKMNKSTSDSLLPEKPASSLWAVAPKVTTSTTTQSKSSLWAVPPQFSAENLNLHPSISNKTEKRTVRFQSVDKDRLPIKSRLPDEKIRFTEGRPPDDWVERPTVERLYKNIDKYLPEHDLDQEILVEAPVMMVTRKSHKKSIRHIANEARTNHLIRRRSTKMWHRVVEQVKPGMDVSVQQAEGLPKTKKLHWVRGELIGKGSFGRVYHAMNIEANEWIAVKQVDLPSTNADYAKPESREIKDGLFREISLLEDLDNEYIVQYLGYDVDEKENHINIFLEYVPGGSIASCLSKTGKFEVALVQFFTRQILLGLAYLHNRNILHRDIKAGNILLDQNGICKITDFGLSKLSGQDKAYDPHSNNSVMRGTVFWMAPEVVKGTNYNAKVDVWSLGCTVIEMLTGSHPWLDLNMLAALYNLGKYQAPPIPEDLPEGAKNFLTKCFTINPEERPTAEQLLTHTFVQPDPAFEFVKHMKNVQVERRGK